MSKTKSKNPTRTFTLRCNQEQWIEMHEKSAALGMPYTAYATDKIFNGKERKRYAKNKIGTTLINTSNAINSLLNQALQTESEYISKEELIPTLNNIREELNSICNL